MTTFDEEQQRESNLALLAAAMASMGQETYIALIKSLEDALANGPNDETKLVAGLALLGVNECVRYAKAVQVTRTN